MKKFLIFIAFLIPCHLFAGLMQDYSAVLKKLAKDGEKVATAKDLKDFEKKAKNEYLKILSKNKKLNDNEKILAARMCLEVNLPQKALSYLKKVKKINNENKNYYYSTLAKTYFLLGEYQKIFPCFEKTDKSMEGVGLDMVNVSLGLIKQKKYKSGEKLLKTALSQTNSINIKNFASIGLMENFELTNRIKEGKNFFSNRIKKATSNEERIIYENMIAELDLIGKKAPEFKSVKFAINRKKISVKNKNFTLLFFFSGKSKRSVIAIPYIDGIFEKYGNKITIIGINLIPEKADFEQYKTFLKKYLLEMKKIRYPVAVLKTPQTYKDYGVYTLPYFVLINTKGEIGKIFIGFPNKEFNPMLNYLSEIGETKIKPVVVKSKSKKR